MIRMTTATRIAKAAKIVITKAARTTKAAKAAKIKAAGVANGCTVENWAETAVWRVGARVVGVGVCGAGPLNGL